MKRIILGKMMSIIAMQATFLMVVGCGEDQREVFNTCEDFLVFDAEGDLIEVCRCGCNLDNTGCETDWYDPMDEPLNYPICTDRSDGIIFYIEKSYENGQCVITESFELVDDLPIACVTRDYYSSIYSWDDFQYKAERWLGCGTYPSIEKHPVGEKIISSIAKYPRSEKECENSYIEDTKWLCVPPEQIDNCLKDRQCDTCDDSPRIFPF